MKQASPFFRRGEHFFDDLSRSNFCYESFGLHILLGRGIPKVQSNSQSSDDPRKVMLQRLAELVTGHMGGGICGRLSIDKVD